METAKQVLRRCLHAYSDAQVDEFLSTFPGNEVENAMVEFGKMCASVAFDAAADNVVYYADTSLGYMINPDSILNAFSLDEIK